VRPSALRPLRHGRVELIQRSAAKRLRPEGGKPEPDVGDLRANPGATNPASVSANPVIGRP
jgi:hypothetical protein